MTSLRVFSLQGFVPYAWMWELQKKAVELRAAGQLQDVLFVLEHEPVVTLGRGIQDRAKRAYAFWREYHGPLPFFEVERGGGLTYHGPGQWVLYPIMKMGKKHGKVFFSLSELLDFLESLLDPLLEQAGLVREHRKERGIWIQGKKIASLGVALRKWVSFHGMALNVWADLKAFFDFSPCGLSPSVMANLSQFMPLPKERWRLLLEDFLKERLSVWGWKVKWQRVSWQDLSLESLKKEAGFFPKQSQEL